MTNSVTFPTSLGGDGLTYTDDASPTTGLGNGGHRVRFIKTLSNTVAVASAAVDAAEDALVSETNAAISAASAAQQANSITSTSNTSLSIATGSKTFTTQAGKQFSAGQFITAVSSANVNNFMYGQITSYSGTTLIVSVTTINGTGTFADWNLSISGLKGATGTGITPQTVGWLATGGTTSKTLTVDIDLVASTVATKDYADALANLAKLHAIALYF